MATTSPAAITGFPAITALIEAHLARIAARQSPASTPRALSPFGAEGGEVKR
jgi:hypothetical protein